MKEALRLTTEQIQALELQYDIEINRFLSVKRRRPIKIVLMFQTDRHVALKLVKTARDYIHLATAFSQTEYNPDEIPKSKLEIKIDEPYLTVENITDATVQHLANNYPQAKKNARNILPRL